MAPAFQLHGIGLPFPHVGRACSGTLFDRLVTAVSLIRAAKTRTGLRTTVAIIERVFETGRNATRGMKDNLRIVYEDLLPKWNYVANP